MKQKNIWIWSMLLFVLSACHWDEEPTLAELYAGTYRGELNVSASAGEETELTDGQVDMIVTGERALQLKFINIKLADRVIDTLVIPALLSLDGQNRLTGKREAIGEAGGHQAHAELEGEMIYGRSELTVYMNVGTEGSVYAKQWVVKFRGIRK